MVSKKILLVDDDPEMRLALGVRLKHHQFEVFSAGDGVAAISEARKHMPDLILLDLGLPAGDGFTVIERLKQNELLSHIPIIVISGRDRLASRDRSLAAGARLFLQKPVSNVELLTAIQQTLGLPGAPRPAAAIVYELAESAPLTAL